jgi:AraC-like DNA-binding protein
MIKKIKINEGKSLKGSFIDTEYVFHYIAAGKWNFRIDSKLYHISPGNILLIPPNIVHIVDPAYGEQLIMLVIHFNIIPVDRRINYLPMVLEIPSEIQKKVTDKFYFMYREWKDKKEAYEIIISGAMTEIIGLYIRNSDNTTPFENISSTNWRNTEAAIQYMRKEFRSPELTITDVCRETGLSYTYFSRIFKKHTSETPLHYLNRIRIEHSKECLYNKNMSCSLAAYDSGFRELHTFSKTFKKYEKKSPTEWIKEMDSSPG